MAEKSENGSISNLSTKVRPDGTFQLGTWTPKDAGQGSFVMCWAHRQGGNFVVHLGYLTIAGPLELTTTFTTAGAVFSIVLTGSSLAASELVVVERAGRPANYACGDAGTIGNASAAGKE